MQIRYAFPIRTIYRRHAYKKSHIFYTRVSLGGLLLIHAGLLILYSCLPSMDMESSPRRDIVPASGANRILWVFLPLLGLKNARRRGLYSEEQRHDFLNTVQKERVSVQSWSLVAGANKSFASTLAPFADVRIIGLVGNPLDCDPWLNTHVSRCYKCLSLPARCLSREFDEIPTVDCIFETILQHVGLPHNDNDVIIYANGDLIFPAFKLLALLSFVYCHSDTNNNKDAVLVGQRRDTSLMDDADGAKLLESGLLTTDNFQLFFSEAMATSVLHADFGIDYFVLPAPVLSSLISTTGFPPFLTGRYRWDNVLLASFILDEIAPSASEKSDRNVGIRTIDITSALPVVHLGKHSASPDYFQAQLGAEYNDHVAQEHFGDLYMVGRVHNTDWILTEASPVVHPQDIPSQVYEIVKRPNKADADLLQAFDRAYYHHHPSLKEGSLSLYGIKSRQRNFGGSPSNELSYPILLLVTVLPRDVPYAKLWMQRVQSKNTTPLAAAVETSDHFLFVTVEQDSYNELEAAFPGTVILEKTFAWPTSAAKWHSFSRLLRNRLTVGIMSAQDVSRMSSNDLLPLLWQQTLSDECDVVLYQGQYKEDTVDRKEWYIFSIRPSSVGIFFWDEYRKQGQENDVEKTDPRSLFAPCHQEKADDEKVCFCGL